MATLTVVSLSSTAIVAPVPVGDPPAAASAPSTSRPHPSVRGLATTQPPPTADPGRPGTAVDSGEDESDPFLLLDRGRYSLYTSGIPATGADEPVNVPVSSSTDFAHWSTVSDAMPALPPWAVRGFTWAPDVHRFGATWVLYFTAALIHTGEQCIGIATGVSPDGPFTARGRPFICQRALGGSIDPRVFTDRGGSAWMLWKSDQNINGSPTPTTLWSERLTRGGQALAGSPSELMRPDRPWQGTVVEAPDMIRVGNHYWLIYSANWFNQPAYAVGAALCTGPAGPCADRSSAPVLASNSQGFGPGEASVFEDAGGVWLLYTPWYFPTASAVPGSPTTTLDRDSAQRRIVEVTRIGVTNQGPYLASGGPPRPPRHPMALPGGPTGWAIP